MTTNVGGTLRTFWAWRADFAAQAKDWACNDGRWYVISFLVHAILVLLLGIISSMFPGIGRFYRQGPLTFQEAEAPVAPGEKLEGIFKPGDASDQAAELSPESVIQMEIKRASQPAIYYDAGDVFEKAGGGMLETVVNSPELGGLGFKAPGLGPGGKGGLNPSRGDSNKPGAGGNGEGFGSRQGKGHQAALNGGATQATERAVGAALNWLYRHQNANGSWSLQHTHRCKGGVCSGAGEFKADSAATAMGVLPFLGSGITPKTKVNKAKPQEHPYAATVKSGLFWLVGHQTSEGDLSANAEQPMYAHALATIALCEAYGMTRDDRFGGPAQKAIRFIERAQNESTGGWRYLPRVDVCDTSVTGWQIMALRSAQVAGLAVSSPIFENTRKWMKLVAKGEHGGLCSYQPYREVTPTMTAVGMLCNQYLGMAREDPAMIESRQMLLANLPDSELRSTYYWYYATLGMHNIMGADWDAWNRKMRRMLTETQIKDGCGTGSWDPERPTTDYWGQKGGRLMMTSLGALTLEVYYRYLPLFKTDIPASEPRPEPVVNK